MRAALVLCLTLVLGAGVSRAEDEAAPTQPLPPHTDGQAAAAFVAYKRDFAESDMDERLKAVRALGRWRHKDVLRELKRLLRSEQDLEIKAAAAEGFGYQVSFASEAGRILADFLKQNEKWASAIAPQAVEEEERVRYEARVLVACWNSVGRLGWKAPWKEWKGYIDHTHDDVASAAIRAFGSLKEYRSLAPLLVWFNIYPDGISWEGGSVSIDTGAMGGVDQAAAEAAWRAKYGGRAKKSRPAIVDALLRTLKDITGQEFTRPDQLKQWMDANKALLKQHGA